MAVPYVPAGHSRVSPYLVTKEADAVIQLLTKAFGAEELHCARMPDGRIMHAEVRIGDSVIMLSEASGQFPALPCMVHVYVADCDATYRQALESGATSLQEPTDQFYGDRSSGVRDAGGNQWWIATHQEDVAPDELARRAAAAGKG